MYECDKYIHCGGTLPETSMDPSNWLYQLEADLPTTVWEGLFSSRKATIMKQFIPFAIVLNPSVTDQRIFTTFTVHQMITPAGQAVS